MSTQLLRSCADSCRTPGHFQACYSMLRVGFLGRVLLLPYHAVIFRAAAQATGCKLKLSFERGTWDLRQNKALGTFSLGLAGEI
jgi:hypothetical protein